MTGGRQPRKPKAGDTVVIYFVEPRLWISKLIVWQAETSPDSHSRTSERDGSWVILTFENPGSRVSAPPQPWQVRRLPAT